MHTRQQTMHAMSVGYAHKLCGNLKSSYKTYPQQYFARFTKAHKLYIQKETNTIIKINIYLEK